MSDQKIDKILERLEYFDDKLNNNPNEKEFDEIFTEQNELKENIKDILIQSIRISLYDFFDQKTNKERTNTVELSFSDANEIFSIFVKCFYTDKIDAETIEKILNNDEETIKNEKNKYFIGAINTMNKLFKKEGFLFFIQLNNIWLNFQNKLAYQYNSWVKRNKN